MAQGAECADEHSTKVPERSNGAVSKCVYRVPAIPAIREQMDAIQTVAEKSGVVTVEAIDSTSDHKGEGRGLIGARIALGIRVTDTELTAR